MQVYIPTSAYEDDEVEKLYGTFEEILEESEEVKQTTS
jgi:hypothetical protein